MKFKNVLTAMLCFLLICSCLLTSCDQQNDENKPSQTTGQTTEATTNQTNETTGVTTDMNNETTQQTTAGGATPIQPPTNLYEKIYVAGKPVSRLLDEPVTVEIANGVTVDLDYLGWPSICVDENDVIYVAASLRLQHVDPLGATAFFKSEDGGETWSKPRIIFDGPLDDRDAGLIYLGNGKMLVSWFTHYRHEYLEGGGYSNWLNFKELTQEQKDAIKVRMASAEGYEAERSSYVMLSDDYGETWGEPIRVPVSTPHGPSLMNNGDLIYLGREWNSASCGIPLATVSATSHYNPLYAFVSSDGGQTWQYRSHIAVPKIDGKFCEPHTIQLSNGRILCSIRVQGNASDEVPYGFTVYTCYSDDNGKTWTLPTLIEDLCGSPPHLLEMDNGVLLMVYACRYQGRQFGQKARLSFDGGETWSDREILLDTAMDSDIGYPATVQLSGGTLITIYYQKYGYDSKCSILYTKWKLFTPEEMRELEQRKNNG